MQKTYERIAVPKIVVCSKSALDDCTDLDECDKRSLGHRKMIRSRSRRHSRRISTTIIDRRSASSSRSPSPSLGSDSQDQDREPRKQTIDATDNRDDVNTENNKNNRLIESGSSKVDAKSTKDEPVAMKKSQNVSDCVGKAEREAKPRGNASQARSTRNGDLDPCESRSSRCSKCTKVHSHREQACLNDCSGYQQYLRLLAVPQANLEWGEGSGDDLSSEWDSDYTDRSSERTIAKVTAFGKAISFGGDRV